MHGHRSEAPAAGSTAFIAQRALLLELVVDPPAGGDPLAGLARRLGLDDAALSAALGELIALGLACVDAHTVRATAGALRFEALGLIRA
jgi:hypothetical protein